MVSLDALLAGYAPQPLDALGWTNTVQRFTGPGGVRFLRTPRSSAAPAPGVAWTREAVLLKYAAGLAPTVLFCDPQTGRLLTEAAPGRPLKAPDLAQAGVAERLGQTLRCLHALPPSSASAFHPAVYALSCLQRAAQQGATVPAPWLALADAERALPLRRDRLAHNDLHGGNLLIDGARLTVLDWELAAPGDPVFDLVTLCCHLALDGKARGTVFRAYGACFPMGAAWMRLEQLHWLREFGWACWAETEGIDEARGQRHSAEAALRRLGAGAI